MKKTFLLMAMITICMELNGQIKPSTEVSVGIKNSAWVYICPKIDKAKVEKTNIALTLATKASLGYNFIFTQQYGGFDIEDAYIKMIMGEDGKVIYYTDNFVNIAKSINVQNSKAYVIAYLRRTMGLKDYIEIDYDVVWKKQDQDYTLMHRVEFRDKASKLYLKAYIDDAKMDFVTIIDQFTFEEIDLNTIIRNASQNQNRTNGGQMACCNTTGVNLNALYHVFDPMTSPTCTEKSVLQQTISPLVFLGKEAMDHISFSDGVRPSRDENTDFFCFDIETPDYNKLHSYIYVRDNFTLAGQAAIAIDVAASNSPTVSINGNTIEFGQGPFNDMAADAFHVVHALYQQQVDPAIASGNVRNGSCDYLVHKLFGTSGICGAYGGLGSGDYIQRNTIFNTYSGAIQTSSSSGPQANHYAQSWSSLLFRLEDGLNGVEGIGATDTKALLEASMQMLENTNIILSAKTMFNIAVNAPFIDNAELCRIYKIMNDYFTGVNDFSIILPVTADYYISDSPADTGVEPYWLSPMWESPDIWNSLSMNGPISPPKSGQTNYIHVVVKNKNGIYDTNKKLHVYFAMASMGLAWPDDWDYEAIPTIACPLDPTCFMQITGELPSSPKNLLGSTTQSNPEVYIFSWTPPDPSEMGMDITDKHHVCIYARITDENNAVKNAQCETEGNDVGNNTNRFNSIAWKNMSIIDGNGLTGGGGNEGTTVFVHNVIPDGDPVLPIIAPNADPYDITLLIEPEPIVPGKVFEGVTDPLFFQKVNLYIDLIGSLNDAWINGETGEGQGFRLVRKGTIQILNSNFRLSNLKLTRGINYLLRVRYEKLPSFSPVSFALELRNLNNHIVGGETFQIFGGSKANPRNITNIANKKLTINPNPASNTVRIGIHESETEISNIKMYDLAGKLILKLNGEVNKYDYELDISHYHQGSYLIKVEFSDGQILSEKFIKN